MRSAHQLVQPSMPKSVSLALFWQFAHRAQAARADIHCTRSTIDFDTTAMYIEHETTARSVLRKRYIVAVHGFALAYVTTTCSHFYIPPLQCHGVNYYSLC